MLTNNGKKRILASSNPNTALTKQTYIDIEGNEYIGTSYSNDYVGNWNYPYTITGTVPSPGYMVLALGKGSMPSSVNDIDLSDRLDDGLFEAASGNTATNAYVNGNLILTKTYKYIGEEDVTITEVGMFFLHRNNKYFLETREVFETPITVSNGDTFTVTMVIG